MNQTIWNKVETLFANGVSKEDMERIAFRMFPSESEKEEAAQYISFWCSARNVLRRDEKTETPVKAAAKAPAKAAAGGKQMIEITYSDGSTKTVPHTKKWVETMNNVEFNRIVGRTYKIIEVQESDRKVFRFSNGMSLEYKGQRKDANACYILVRDNKIVCKGFSNKGIAGAEKAMWSSWTARGHIADCKAYFAAI